MVTLFFLIKKPVEWPFPPLPLTQFCVDILPEYSQGGLLKIYRAVALKKKIWYVNLA